jgi:hypothetical protein
MNSDVNDEVEAFKRNLLSERLALCTEDQQTRFHKWFPTVREEDLVNAISLVNRTLKANEDKP